MRTALNQAGLFGISVEATGKAITLRGTVPEEKMAVAVRIASETGRKQVKTNLPNSK